MAFPAKFRPAEGRSNAFPCLFCRVPSFLCFCSFITLFCRFSLFLLWHGEKQPQFKPSILRINCRRPAVAVSNALDALQPIAVVARVSLGCRRHTVHKAQLAAVTVLHADAQKVLLAHGGNVNQALLRVREFLHAFDCVVQRIAKQGADVHRVHEIQRLSVGDAG